VVGGFANDLYWSSTVSDNFNAWFQDFDYGLQYSDDMGAALSVRAVRAF
jgi:hypothetical protein